MEVVVVGLSHKTAPLEVRERLAYPAPELHAALIAARRLAPVAEVMILSTCNRVELYAATEDAAAATSALRHYLADSRGQDSEQLAQVLYEHVAEQAIRHLFRVTSSLDSMVVGEPQILGQVKDAYGAAAECGTVGSLLHRSLTRAFAVAKRVRSETGIARNAASVSSVAVELASHIFADLAGRRVLVLGAGAMAGLAARHLQAAGCGEIEIVNRSSGRAEELAREVGGRARRWEQLDALLGSADIVICSTGSPQPVLTTRRMQQVTRARRHRPLFLVDIAVPRDVEAAVAEIDGLYLYDIDDLEKVLADNLRGRAREAHKGEKIVDDEVRQFAAWLRTQAVVPTLRQLREHFVGVAQAEAARTCAHLPQAGERERRAIEATAEAIVNKLLHRPLTALKRDSAAQDGGELVGAVRRLFELAPAAETRLDAAEVEQAAAAALGTDAEGSSGGGRGELATAQSTEKR